MAASPDEPTAAADETSAVRTPGATSLPRRSRRTSAIADAAGSTSRTPTDWTGGRTATPRARQAAALPEEPEKSQETPREPESSYADGFAAGLAFASRSASDGEHAPSTPPAPDAAAEPRRPAARPRRSRKVLLVGAGLVVGVLVCVPFLVRGGGDDGRGAAPVTLADTVPGQETTEAGADAPSPSGTASPSAGRSSRQSPAGGAPGGAPSPSGSGGGSASGTKGGGAVRPPTASPSHSAGVPGVAIRSHASGRCIDGSTPWGTPLQIWDCTGSAPQSWRIRPDGSVRAMGKCMDVAGGSRDDGAAVQLVDCNGTGAQQFRLNAAHDLVNLQADKCVEVEDSPGVNGSRLRLWSCTGADEQKWSKA